MAGAIRSVLTQTYTDHEIIVVDDGSSDRTADVAGATSDRVRVIGQSNAGVSAARDRGAAAASAEIVAFLDADDEWLPRKLEVQMARLRARPEIVASFVGSVGWDERTGLERRIDYRLPPEPLRALAYGPIIGNASSVAIRRLALAAVGGFDHALSQSADWDMWLRLAARGQLDYVDEPLVRIRQGRPRSLTSDVRLLERDSLAVLAKLYRSDAGRALRRERSRVYGWHYLTFAGSYLAAGHAAAAIRCTLAGLAHDPRALGRVVRAALRRAGGASLPAGGPPV